MLTLAQITRNVQEGLKRLISEVLEDKHDVAKYQTINDILQLAENPDAENIHEDLSLIQRSLQDPNNTLLSTVTGEKTELDAEIAKHCAYYSIICALYNEIKNDDPVIKNPVCHRMNRLLDRIIQEQAELRRQAGREYGANMRARHRGLTLFGYEHRARIYICGFALSILLFRFLRNISRNNYLLAIIPLLVILPLAARHLERGTFDLGHRRRITERIDTERQALAAMIDQMDQHYDTLTQPLRDYLRTLTAGDKEVTFDPDTHQLVASAANMALV